MNNPLRFLSAMLALTSPDLMPDRRFAGAVKSPKTKAQWRRRAKGLAGRRHRKLIRRMERSRA